MHVFCFKINTRTAIAEYWYEIHTFEMVAEIFPPNLTHLRYNLK